MKKPLVAALGLVAMAASPAFAADMARPYTKAPPAMVSPVFNWNGFYIGGNAGWGSSHDCAHVVAATLTADGCRNPSGAVLGGQLGYRWQLNQFVFGLEAQGDWADMKSSHVAPLIPADTNKIKTDAFGLFTGQIGYAWNAALFYVKGGAAVTSNHLDLVNTATGAGVASGSGTRWGASVGAGFEYGFAPNWSVGLDYDHLFMGDKDRSVTTLTGLRLTEHGHQDVDLAMVRVDYRFGWGGAPVAAKY